MKLEDSGLKPDLQNANEGTQRGRGLLEKSLRKLGAGRSILADKHGNIIAGNKTLEGAAEIDLPVRIVETDGKELVVVKRMDLDLYSDTDKRGRKLAYADNKIAELDLAWKPEQISADFEPLELGEWGFELEQEDDSNTEPDIISLGIKHKKWNYRKGIGFLSLREFTVKKKDNEMESLKTIKRDGLFILEIAEEISQAIKSTIGDVSDFTVATAPKHKTGYSQSLCNKIAELLDCQFVELFTSEINPVAKRNIFGERPEIKIAESVPAKILFIDDTCTTGRTIETCKALANSKTFLPVVWIYSDAEPKE